ncbi:MAG: FecR domain-containing protein [Tannerellaceae bacterium]|jgi:ferric-dicitrate binding protein FerR (iron transport regulator)|nr:FecR domain-containing protein [Tannerellaceae bacterium]
MDIQYLLQHYIKGDATPDEKRRVIRWLEEDDTHIHEYRALRKLHDWNTWNMETSCPKKCTKTVIWSKWVQEFFKIASVLLIGVLVTYFVIHQNGEELQMQTLHVPHGQRAELHLSDGTEVWLNSGSTLTFPDRFAHSARSVTLDGEGYFKVTKNEKKPFTVQTAHYDVHVLGTEFNVISYSKNNYFETSLLKGSVDIVTENMKPVRLKENERLYVKDEKTVKGQIPDFNYFKWREGLICFEKENLASLFRKLELYYDVRIIVENKSLLDWSYNGKFRIRDGIEHVLRVLQRRHQFEYTKNEEDSIIIIE